MVDMMDSMSAVLMVAEKVHWMVALMAVYSDSQMGTRTDESKVALLVVKLADSLVGVMVSLSVVWMVSLMVSLSAVHSADTKAV
jgi:hypothetical protein